MGGVLAVLVGVNVYVFFFSQGSLAQVKQAAQAASLRAPDDPALLGRGLPPLPGVGPAVGPAPGEPAPSERPAHTRDGVVKEREGLGAVLRREGLTGADADGALRALQPIMNFRTELRGGQTYSLRLAAGGRLERFVLYAAPGLRYTVERGEGGKLGAERTEPPRKPVRPGGAPL